MVDAPLRILLQQLHRRRDAAGVAGPSDAALLERFSRTRDEAAFELLVWRHGTLVHNVCRRVLRDPHAAEDAFQATFLVLVRRAGSIRQREALAAWLYRVALRVALRARGQAGPPLPNRILEPAVEPDDELLWRDLRPVLDEEVQRLPAKYRLPVIFCYLSGLTTDEAARQLGVPRGTVLSRLAWARERLRTRLSLRGVTLSAAMLAALLGSAADGPAAPPVVTFAVQAALSFVKGPATAASTGAVHLMEGVLRDMVLNKIKNGVLVVLGLLILGAGVGLWMARPATADAGDGKRELAPRVAVPAAAEPKEPPRTSEAPRPIGVWERKVVLDKCNVTVTIRIGADRISVSGTATEGGEKGRAETILVEGDYSVSRDYVLYGFVTLAEVGAGTEGNSLKEQMAILDQPFSLRYRADDHSLTIRDIKVAGLERKLEDLQVLCGRYKKKELGKEERPW
jgi:RNA polymerase sigma factor (sigma-70 family)